MLGYNTKDLDNMIDALGEGMRYLPPSRTDVYVNLNNAKDFLEGLWAEGYFQG